MKKKQQAKAQPNAVFKLSKRCAKTDVHKKHRYSVFATSKPAGPLKALMLEQLEANVVHCSSNRAKRK